MPTSPIATFINHDLHNKFGVLRTANGMLEMLLEKLPPDQREPLEKQSLLINQTLDRLSESVGNYTDCLNLEVLLNDEEIIDVDYNFEKIISNLEKSGWEVKAEKYFGEMKIKEEVFSFIFQTIINTIQTFGVDQTIEIIKGDQQELIVTFQDGPGDKSNYKNIRELLNGKMKPEAVPHYFNLFFANYLLQKRSGKIELEYLQPGSMSFLINPGKN